MNKVEILSSMFVLTVILCSIFLWVFTDIVNENYRLKAHIKNECSIVGHDNELSSLSDI